MTIEGLELQADTIRQDVIKMLDIFTALYFDILKHDPKNPDWNERDILILSNGHTVPARYAAMARAGYFPVEELMTLRKLGSRLQGHPERVRLPGLETTSGALGSGLSQACGIALAMRMDKVTHRWVYVIMGDGELDEGNIWEAAMLGSKYKLGNIIAIVDRNNIQSDGPTEAVMPLEDLNAKWEGFGWQVIEINGNNMSEIINACALGRSIVDKPVVIIAHTIPGKGVDFMESDYRWHALPPGLVNVGGAPPKAEQAKDALYELRTLRGKIKSEAD